MKRRLQDAKSWLVLRAKSADLRSVMACAAFAAIVIGLWWERPSLALIVPGGVVFTLLVVSHLRGDATNA